MNCSPPQLMSETRSKKRRRRRREEVMEEERQRGGTQMGVKKILGPVSSIFFFFFLAMASCVLGCVVTMATVTWWPRYFCLIQCWNYGCSTLLPGCPDNIIIANEAGEWGRWRRRKREEEGDEKKTRLAQFFFFFNTITSGCCGVQYSLHMFSTIHTITTAFILLVWLSQQLMTGQGHSNKHFAITGSDRLINSIDKDHLWLCLTWFCANILKKLKTKMCQLRFGISSIVNRFFISFRLFW